MMLPIYFFLYKLRFVFSGMLVATAGFLVVCAVALTSPMPVQATDNTTSVAYNGAETLADDPNAVTDTLVKFTYNTERALRVAAVATNNSLQSAGSAMAGGGKAVGHGIQWGVATTFSNMSKSVMFVVRIPGAMLGFVTHSSVVDAVIKPVDHSEVPIIDPESPDVLAAKEALYTAKPATPAAPVVDTKTVWPIHGQVTTEFGVPEWPYQAVHTGMDISDGSWRGTTPIVAFRQGKVIAVEHAGGLGNHVIVDHGSGVTSVYGHMTSTAVQVGQEVNTTTTLGYEGSTGVSTGPHVHFEIRVNGQATDPRKFINGQP